MSDDVQIEWTPLNSQHLTWRSLLGLARAHQPGNGIIYFKGTCGSENGEFVLVVGGSPKDEACRKITGVVNVLEFEEEKAEAAA